MSKDEIQLALRHIAIGRVNTEAVMEFCDKLEKLLAKDACEYCVMPGGEHFKFCPSKPVATLESAIATTPLPDPTVDPVQFVQEVAKRGPGRPKKAE